MLNVSKCTAVVGNSEVAVGFVLSERYRGDDVCLPTCQGENGNMVHGERCSLPGHHRLFTLGERRGVLLCSLEAAGRSRVVSKLGQGHQMTNWFLSQNCPWEGPCTYSSGAMGTDRGRSLLDLVRDEHCVCVSYCSILFIFGSVSLKWK